MAGIAAETGSARRYTPQLAQYRAAADVINGLSATLAADEQRLVDSDSEGED